MNSPPENICRPEKKLLIIGFGDIAKRLAPQLNAKGWDIHGLCRSQKVSDFATLHLGSAGDPSVLEKVLAIEPSQILVTMTPDGRSPQAYRAAYVQVAHNLAETCAKLQQTPHILFVSSTAVYGQEDGSVVDEMSETMPHRFNGQILLEAEKIYQDSQLPLSVLRFSGIYGRGYKKMQDRLRSESSGFNSGRWSNRIHIEDVLGVVRLVLDSYSADGGGLGVILASDLRPEQEGVIENWLRSSMQLPAINFDEPVPSSGKRCNGFRLRELGYQFVVKDFTVGYLEGR